jgi:hypothetical protein
MTAARQPNPGRHSPNTEPPPARSLRWRHWNLLLLLPFVGLITPLFNRDEPRLLGWPFYYWGYLVAVLLGCVCLGLTVHFTQDRARPGEEE